MAGRSTPAARTFIATAEKIFRDHRNDPAFDFGPVVGNFAKALEVSVNAILARVLPDVPAHERQAAMDGRTVDLLERLPLTLGQFAHAVGGERAAERRPGSATGERRAGSPASCR